MNVSDELKQAWSDVEAASLPEHVQAIALGEALRMRAGGQAATQQENPGPKINSRQSPAKSTGVSPSEAVPGEVDESFFAKIERETGESTGTLETIIFLKDGAPSISAPKRMLGRSLKQSQVNVTTLITVARHFGLGETEISDSVVRAECQRLGVFDRNFASNVKGIAGILQSGDRTKVFKIRANAIDAFASAVAAVSGEGGQA